MERWTVNVQLQGQRVNVNFPDRFSKNTYISDSLKMRLVGAELCNWDRQTDRHDEADSRPHQSVVCLATVSGRGRTGRLAWQFEGMLRNTWLNQELIVPCFCYLTLEYVISRCSDCAAGWMVRVSNTGSSSWVFSRPSRATFVPTKWVTGFLSGGKSAGAWSLLICVRCRG